MFKVPHCVHDQYITLHGKLRNLKSWFVFGFNDVYGLLGITNGKAFIKTDKGIIVVCLAISD